MNLKLWRGRTLVGVTGSLLLLFAAVGSAAAAPPEVEARNEPLAFPDIVDSSSCPGITFIAHLEGERSRTSFYSQDGELLRTVIQVRYMFTFTNADDPTIVARSPGHRHIELDFANNTYTDTGIYRNTTMVGVGNIEHVTGRYVETLDTAEPTAVNGPHEDMTEFCAAMAG